MSEDVTPENTLGGEPGGSTGPPASDGKRRQLHEMWVAGTEEPSWVVESTAEGVQFIADFIAIIAGIDLIMGEVDR